MLYKGRDERGDISYLKYKAAAEDCKNFSLRAARCGGNQKHSRSIVHSKESPVMNASREKMATGQAQAVYRRRGPIAEFVDVKTSDATGTVTIVKDEDVAFITTSAMERLCQDI